MTSRSRWFIAGLVVGSLLPAIAARPWMTWSVLAVCALGALWSVLLSGGDR